MIGGVGLGFITYYLQELDYSSSAIGWINAGFALLSVFLQPLLGRLSDTNQSFTWKNILVYSAILLIVFFLIIYFVDLKPWSGLLFGSVILVIYCMMPFVNGAIFYYERIGERVDFGSARGFGSFGYAFISYLLGYFTTLWNERIVIVVGICASLLFLVFVMQLPCKEELWIDQSTEKKSSFDFVTKYPALVVMIIGNIFLFSFHNLSNTFLINILENVGGDSASLGVAIALAAIVEIPILFMSTKLLHKYKGSYLMIFAAISFVIKAALYLFAKTVLMVYVAQLFQMFSYAVDVAVFAHICDEAVEPEDKMLGQAWNTTSISAGLVIGSLLGGMILDAYGLKGMLMVGVIFCIIGLGFMALSSHMFEKEKRNV
ncbi:MAG: MFS transporter [Solobacterium sp.]|nr:MFS transporter [Solobacterium sp.]